MAGFGLGGLVSGTTPRLPGLGSGLTNTGIGGLPAVLGGANTAGRRPSGRGERWGPNSGPPSRPGHPYPWELEHDDPNWRPYYFPGTNKPRPTTYPPGYGDYNDGRGPEYHSAPEMIPWPTIPAAPAPIPGTGPKHGGRDR